MDTEDFPMKKILFVDIDGVLNNIAWAEAGNSILAPEEVEITQQSTGWDPENVKWLKHIIDETDAGICIVSAWMFLFDTPQFDQMFSAWNVVQEVEGVTLPTENQHNATRGELVRDWIYWGSMLGAVDVQSFAIIDDYADGYDEELPVVAIDPWKGLTEEDAKTAIKLLNDVDSQRGLLEGIHSNSSD